jgi:putative inorganic carbon (HCO3(-)) transporter
MSQTEITSPNLFKNKYFILMTVIIAAIAVGMTGSLNPLILLGGVASLLLLMVFLKWPDSTVVFVVFFIYANIVVVLTKFQGLPLTAGYVLPLLLLIPFIGQLLVDKRRIKINFVLILMMLYLSIILIGSVFSRDINSTIPDIITYVVEGLGLYFLLINTIRTPKLLKQIVWSLLIAGALMGGLSLYQQLTGTFDNNYGGFAQVDGKGFATGETLQGQVYQLRVAGPIGEKNRYAQILLMLVPLGFFLAWGEQSRKLRLLAFILTGLIFIGSALAYSRGAQVAFLILIIIMTFLKYIKINQLFIILLGLVILLQVFPQINQRFSSLGAIFSSKEQGGLENADGSIQGRATEMLVALLVFRDHPIIGVGPGMYRYEVKEYSELIGYKNIAGEREAHSLYLGLAAETGILGFITMMGIFFYTLYRLARSRAYWLERNQKGIASLCTGFFLAVVSYMATGIFLHINYIRYLWLILALAAIVSEFSEADIIDDPA